MHILVPIILASLTIGGSVYVAHEAGYIPIEQTLQIQEPINYQQVCGSCLEEKYRNVLDEIPNLDKIKYEVYISSSNRIEVANDYIQKMTNDGYNLEYQGMKTVYGVDVYYYGFVKGITVVGIAISNGADIGYPEANSIILYTTGNALDYQEIINWYKDDGLSDIENPNSTG